MYNPSFYNNSFHCHCIWRWLSSRNAHPLGLCLILDQRRADMVTRVPGGGVQWKWRHHIIAFIIFGSVHTFSEVPTMYKHIRFAEINFTRKHLKARKSLIGRAVIFPQCLWYCPEDLLSTKSIQAGGKGLDKSPFFKFHLLSHLAAT